MIDKIPVDSEGLKFLADSAVRNEKAEDFIPVALQWAEGATSEIERMRAEIRAVCDKLARHPAHWSDEAVIRSSLVRLRALLPEGK